MLKKLFTKKAKSLPTIEDERFPVPEREADVRQFIPIVENWKLDEIRTFVVNKHPEYKLNEAHMIALIHRFNYLRLPQKGFPKGRKEIEKNRFGTAGKKVINDC
jgi:hypothetical protein